ncbi:hypothetical protein [Pontibacterium sp.]|uniref:hypothetical protein n=1 Tax=Pontibacterium sp. TaxID=2036026 RepID=UPI0035669896
MLAQAAVQPSVTVRNPVQAVKACATVKQEKPMMREVAKSQPQPKVEEPRYDFVGIAG